MLDLLCSNGRLHYVDLDVERAIKWFQLVRCKCINPEQSRVCHRTKGMVRVTRPANFLFSTTWTLGNGKP